MLKLLDYLTVQNVFKLYQKLLSCIENIEINIVQFILLCHVIILSFNRIENSNFKKKLKSIFFCISILESVTYYFILF